MLKHVLAIVLIFIVILLVFFGVTWQYAGLREHVGFMQNISALPEESHRTSMRSMFYTGFDDYSDGSISGGIIANANSYGVWLWVKYLPKYYEFSTGTKLGISRNCSLEKRFEFVNGNIDSRSKLEYSLSPNQWLNEIDVGTHVFVYLDGNRVVAVIANPDVKLVGYEPLFCRYDLKL